MREGWEMKRLGEFIEIKNGKNQQAIISKNNNQKLLGRIPSGRAIRSNLFCLAGQKRISTTIPYAKKHFRIEN